MPFQLFQDVILTGDLPESGFCAGDIGTVIDFHPIPDGEPGEPGCSVEFFDLTGGTIAVVTVSVDMLRAPTAADLPSVRVRPRRTG